MPSQTTNSIDGLRVKYSSRIQPNECWTFTGAHRFKTHRDATPSLIPYPHSFHVFTFIASSFLRDSESAIINGLDCIHEFNISLLTIIKSQNHFHTNYTDDIPTNLSSSSMNSYGAERITYIRSVPPLIVHLHNLYTVTKIDREKHRITIIVLYKSMFIMIFIYCILL